MEGAEDESVVRLSWSRCTGEGGINGVETSPIDGIGRCGKRMIGVPEEGGCIGEIAALEGMGMLVMGVCLGGRMNDDAPDLCGKQKVRFCLNEDGKAYPISLIGEERFCFGVEFSVDFGF